MRTRRAGLAAVLVVMSMLAAACGGDDDAQDTGEEASETSVEESGSTTDSSDVTEATAPVEALRVSFESNKDGPFHLFDLDGDLWLVDSDFSAIRIDPTSAVSSCDTTSCLSASGVSFGDTFIPVGARLFTVDTKTSPNHFAWLGSELDDAPHLVQDGKVAPGDATGDFSEHIIRLGDWLYAYDAQSDAIESVDATVEAIDTAPVIGTPISTTQLLDPDSDVETPFPENTRLVTDGETLWIYSTSQQPLFPSGDNGPPPAAAVDVEAGTLGPIFGMTPADDMVDFDEVHQVAAAGGHLVVARTLVDRDTGGENFEDYSSVVTAFAPDGTGTDFEMPDVSIRNLITSGDRVLAVTHPEGGTQAFALDPADGSAIELDLGIDPDVTVTATYGDDNGVWAVVDGGRGESSTLLRIDLGSGSVIERIELTAEYDDAFNSGFVQGRPYFVLGDGTSGEWELVVLGGEGIDLGYAAPPPADDDTANDDTADDSDSDGPDTDEPGSDDADTEEPGTDPPGDDATSTSEAPAADEPAAPPPDDECAPGESLAECYG